jgi:hypothetical protein
VSRFPAFLLLGLVLAQPLAGQGPGFQLAHLFTDPSGNAYRVDWSSRLLGPVGLAPLATVIDSRSPIGNLWAVGLDLSLFRGGRPGLYAIGGLEGGVATEGSKTFRGAWSAGLGYEVFPFGGFSLAAEGRYRQVGPGTYGGLQFGVRLGLDRGSRRSSGGSGRGTAADAPGDGVGDAAPEVAAIRTDLGAKGVPADRAELIGGVVQTALDVMGLPYRWGDDGEEGFDCSGLIRYAFGKHGIALPRRSREQAQQGEGIAKNLDSLQAGDILTFSTQGRGISHVGLYVGNGKFIHSARQGVQLSVLSPEDVSGRWWYQRWVGARRVVR